MSEKDGHHRRVRYAVAFKVEAVRLVKAGQGEARSVGRDTCVEVPKQPLSNCLKLADQDTLDQYFARLR